MAALKRQLEALTDLADDVTKAVKRAWEAFDEMEGSDQPLKDSFGKITEAGVAMMHHMFKSGDPNSKIAEAFDISPSAVSYRRSRWIAQKS
jgi:FixJ family two-component response regulator